MTASWLRQTMRLIKIDPEANLRRFYCLKIVRGLFGEWGLVREWGRIGRGGQMRTDWFNTEAAAREARFRLHMTKAKRGYE